MDAFASNSTRAASIEKEPGCDSRLSAMRTRGPLRKRAPASYWDWIIQVRKLRS